MLYKPLRGLFQIPHSIERCDVQRSLALQPPQMVMASSQSHIISGEVLHDLLASSNPQRGTPQQMVTTCLLSMLSLNTYFVTVVYEHRLGYFR